MNKQTKTLLLVGGGVVVAYLVYKSMTKKNTTDNTDATTTAFANAMGSARLGYKPRTACKRSPENAQVLTAPDGTKAYECCGDGIYGSKPGPTPCKTKQGTTEITQAGKVFAPSSNSRIFK